MCFLRVGVRLFRPRVPFSGITELLRLSYFIESCYLAALLSGLGVNASVRFVYPWFIVFFLCGVLRAALARTTTFLEFDPPVTKDL